MPYTIIRQDITQMKVDAIVNAANTHLQQGGGVCGMIFEAAGPEALQQACDSLSPIKTGEAVITPGFSLPARYVIHTPGPVYQGGTHGEEKLLRACYENSLLLALKHGCESIAFPLISGGIYGYPKAEALRVASETIAAFLAEHEMDVYMLVFDKAALAISRDLMGEVSEYIDEHFVDARAGEGRRMRRYEVQQEILMYRAADEAAPAKAQASSKARPAGKTAGLEALVGHLDEPFGQTLLRLIDAKGKTDVEVYKSANLDRKLFSKIRTGKDYMPGKRTVLALAIALELSLTETEDLLKRAGYALTRTKKIRCHHRILHHPRPLQHL